MGTFLNLDGWVSRAPLCSRIPCIVINRDVTFDTTRTVTPQAVAGLNPRAPPPGEPAGFVFEESHSGSVKPLFPAAALLAVVGPPITIVGDDDLGLLKVIILDKMRSDQIRSTYI